MANLYRKAKRVLIWFGVPKTASEKVAPGALKRLARLPQKWLPGSYVWPYGLISAMLSLLAELTEGNPSRACRNSSSANSTTLSRSRSPQ